MSLNIYLFSSTRLCVEVQESEILHIVVHNLMLISIPKTCNFTDMIELKYLIRLKSNKPQ